MLSLYLLGAPSWLGFPAIQGPSVANSSSDDERADLMFAGGSILGMNSNATYATPTTATTIPATYFHQ